MADRETLEKLRKEKRLRQLQAKSEGRPDPFITTATQPFEGVSGPRGGAGEAALAVGTSLVGELAGGITGAANQMVINPAPPIDERLESLTEPGLRETTLDEKVGALNTVRDAIANPPSSPEGKQALVTLGEQVDQISRIMKMPLSALDAAVSGAATGSIDQVTRRFEENQETPNFLGERVFATTGNPELATAATIAPDLLLEGMGLGVANRAARQMRRVADRVKAATNKPDIKVFDEGGKFTDEAIDALEVLQKQTAPKASPKSVTPEEAARIDEGIAGLDSAEEIIQEAADAGAILTPEQAKRLNLFRERGVTPLAADITRKTGDSIDQQQAIKEGGIIADVAAGQEQQLARLVREGITKTGGIAGDAEEASASIRGVITGVATDLDNKVSQAYRAARGAAEGNSVDVSDYIEFVKNNRGKDKITGGVVSSALSDLKNRGLSKKDSDTFISVKDAEEIRQGLNKDFESATPRGKAMIRQMKEAIDTDVEATVGTDIFADARAANIRFKSAIKRARRDKFDKTKGSLIEDILDNKIPEEKIFGKIISPATRADDIEKLRDFLLNSGDVGKQAWDDLRAQTLRNALDKALSTVSVREGGQVAFNARLFRNELKRIRGKKFDLLFNPDEKQLISDIETIGFSRIPISGTFAGEGPSSIAVKKAVGEARDSILGRIPAVGPLAEGMLDALKTKRRNQNLMQFTDETEKAIKRGQ